MSTKVPSKEDSVEIRKIAPAGTKKTCPGANRPLKRCPLFCWVSNGTSILNTVNSTGFALGAGREIVVPCPRGAAVTAMIIIVMAARKMTILFLYDIRGGDFD